jgi:hypothetical protein
VSDEDEVPGTSDFAQNSQVRPTNLGVQKWFNPPSPTSYNYIFSALPPGSIWQPMGDAGYGVRSGLILLHQMRTAKTSVTGNKRL